MTVFKCLLLLSAISFQFSTSQRLHEQIYSSIKGGAACFRRLNGTHQAGCSTSDRGSLGVVQVIKSMSDAEWMILKGSAGPYVAVLSNTSLFNDVVEVFMKNPNNVAGMVIYDNETERGTSFTEESRCPNEYSSAPGSQCSTTKTGGIVWNEKGTGLLQRDIPFPIFYLPSSQGSEIDKIEECYDRFNNEDKENQRGRPLCSIQLNSFMFAAVNTDLCLRRSARSAFLTPTKACDPLGDLNVFYTLFPRGTETADSQKTVTMVSSRLDTASLFDGISPGAASTVVGMVTQLAAATLLSKLIPTIDANLYKHNILWMFFNGEAFDYIGSQRVAYDLKKGNFPPNKPLNVTELKLHVEIGQIGGSFLSFKDNASWPLNAYGPYTSTVPPAANEFLVEMASNLNKNNLTVEPIFSVNLPPSSLHSFRRTFKNETENGDLPQLLLTDFKDTFTNAFYHSALDDPLSIGYVYRNISAENGTFIDTTVLLANGTMKESDLQVKIARLATALSHSLFQRVTGAPYAGDMASSAHLVDELLYCFMKSQACKLLAAADYGSAKTEGVPERPAPLYVGVMTWPGSMSIYTGHLLALLTGDVVSTNQTACQEMQQNGDFAYHWLKGWNHTGVCIRTTMNMTNAVSPAFIIQDYDYSSGKYSTWTESVWQPMSLRMFVASSGAGARAAAIAGAIATAVVSFTTYWLRKHARYVFISPASSIANSEATTGILRTVNC